MAALAVGGLVALMAAAGLGILVGVQLGKQRVKEAVLLNLDYLLRTDQLVVEATPLTAEQRNAGLIENLKRIRKETNAL